MSEDREDDFTPTIKALHPMETGRHELYQRALELVGNRHSKHALVDLVNALLVSTEKYDSQKVVKLFAERMALREHCERLEADLEQARKGLLGNRERVQSVYADFFGRIDALEQGILKMREAMSQVLGAGHVLKGATHALHNFPNDPVWADPQQIRGELKRLRDACLEWHQRVVAALETTDGLVKDG